MQDEAKETLKIKQLLDKAASDPAFMEQIREDPLGAARNEGVQLSSEQIKHMLGMPGATDAELIEVLRSRVSHAATSCK